MFRRRAEPPIDGTSAPPTRIVAFDFDGVIADSLDVYYPLFSACCQDLGFQGPPTRAAFLDVFDTNAVKGLRRAGVPFLKLRALSKALGPRVTALNEQIQPFPVIAALIAALQREHPVYVVTSNATEATRQFMALHGMTGIADVIGADREASKVKKLRRIRKRHKQARVWYVGDTKGDMIEARRAGVIAVGACWGWHARVRLATAAPDYLVDTPTELAALLGVVFPEGPGN